MHAALSRAEPGLGSSAVDATCGPSVDQKIFRGHVIKQYGLSCNSKKFLSFYKLRRKGIFLGSLERRSHSEAVCPD